MPLLEWLSSQVQGLTIGSLSAALVCAASVLAWQRREQREEARERRAKEQHEREASLHLNKLNQERIDRLEALRQQDAEQIASLRTDHAQFMSRVEMLESSFDLMRNLLRVTGKLETKGLGEEFTRMLIHEGQVRALGRRRLRLLADAALDPEKEDFEAPDYGAWLFTSLLRKLSLQLALKVSISQMADLVLAKDSHTVYRSQRDLWNAWTAHVSEDPSKFSTALHLVLSTAADRLLTDWTPIPHTEPEDWD